MLGEARLEPPAPTTTSHTAPDEHAGGDPQLLRPRHWFFVVQLEWHPALLLNAPRPGAKRLPVMQRYERIVRASLSPTTYAVMTSCLGASRWGCQSVINRAAGC